MELNMKKYFKKTSTIALISLCGLSLTGLATAMPNDGDRMMKHGNIQLEREYSLTEINTLVEAKLLRSRNAETSLESIEKTAQGTFLVTLSGTEEGEKSFELNKYGLPVDAPFLGLFSKHGGKGGKKGKGQCDKGERGYSKHFGKQGDISPEHEERMAEKAERRQEKREAYIEKHALTLEEMTTLAEARLIRLNNESLKLGEVTSNDEGGYTVTILSTNNDLVSRVKLNEAGFPELKKKHHKG